MPTVFENLRRKGYVLGDMVSEGGFGVIYRAVDVNVLKRPVAIKVIGEKYANDPQFIRRFHSEAQIIAGLEHPHMIPLYDYWREPNSAFIVLRWLSGGTVADRLTDGPMPLSEVRTVVDQILSALSFAHRRRIVHRDLSPTNIMFDGDRNALLGDFGISTSIDALEDWTEKVAGSVNYLAPEQTSKDSLSPATDLFSFGIVLFEMLTGRHPFDQQLLAQTRREVPPASQFNAELPVALDEVIRRVTAKAPEERYQSAPDLRAAIHAALGDSSAADAHLPIPKSDAPNPYNGTAPFLEGDATHMFGREETAQHLLDHMGSDGQRGRFLGIVGPSGSGKSSAVRAGLIPRLRAEGLPNSGRWFFTSLHPSEHPFEALETALLRIAGRRVPDLVDRLSENDRGLAEVLYEVLPENREIELVLIIDQFDELVRMIESEADRSLLLRSLVTAMSVPDSRLRVIITMRSDFYDRTQEYGEFGALLRRCARYLPPLTEEDLTAAIVKPAAALGVEFADGLVPRMLQELGDGASRLPLLQYALKAVFDIRRTDLITHDDYSNVGGIVGTLARRAEDSYQSLDRAQQEAARQVFVRLVMTGTDGLPARRRARLNELMTLAPAEVAAVIAEFSGRDIRLLTTDRDEHTRQPTVEVTHEEVILSWGRLRDWLHDEREGLIEQRRLTAAAQEWNDSGRQDALLASGLRLSNFMEWRRTTTLDLTDVERAYLEASDSAESEQRRFENERRADTAQTATRARSLARASLVLGIVAILAIAATVVAVRTGLTASNDLAVAREAAQEVAAEAEVFHRKVERATTLSEGGVVVDLDDLAESDSAFLDAAAAAKELSLWEPRREVIDDVNMVYVPAGCFWMGSGYDKDQLPVAEMCLDQPYWIDEFEVTNEQFDAHGGVAAEQPLIGDADQPRAMITPLEARAYCLTRDARLPTEVEWEFAARGPNSYQYPWGNELDSSRLASKETSEGPLPVGSFPAGVSWVGAHDMSGNVREIMHTKRSDLLADETRHVYELPYDGADGRENVTRNDETSFYLLRGGSYASGIAHLRTSSRNWTSGTTAKEEHGFRCVRDIESAS